MKCWLSKGIRGPPCNCSCSLGPGKISSVEGFTGAPLKPLDSAVMLEGFQRGLYLGPICREKPVSRTAVRLIAVVQLFFKSFFLVQLDVYCPESLQQSCREVGAVVAKVSAP